MVNEDPRDYQLILDLRGLKCPLPVLKTRKAIASLKTGSLLRVETTDPLAGLDLPHFCNEDGHLLVSQSKTDVGHLFVIRKG